MSDRSIPSRSRKAWYRRLRYLFRQRWRRIMVLNDTPHRIAWGVVLGNIIGWLPIVGIQMPLSAVSGWILRVNVVAAVAMVWLSNPITVVPIYWVNYKVGALFTGGDFTFERIAALANQIRDLGPWRGMRLFVVDLFVELFVPMCIGGLIIGVVTSVPLYFLTLRAVARFQAHRARIRARWLLTRREPGMTSRVQRLDKE